MIYGDQAVNITEYEAPRFDADDPGLVKHFEENGYVIVKQVACSQTIAECESLLWEFLSSECGMIRDDPSTWGDENFCKIGGILNGIISGKGIGQSQFLWRLRLLPSVRKSFEAIWCDDNLITSFDGANVFRPWHDPEFQDRTATACGWFHVDQGPQFRGLQTVQGLVSLTDGNATTGGFVCIPKSHLYHDELMEKCGEGRKQNFIMVPPDFHVLQHQQLLPKIYKGDMILWDSRTVTSCIEL